MNISNNMHAFIFSIIFCKFISSSLIWKWKLFFSTTLMYLVFSILIISAVTKCRRLYFSMLFLISKKNGLETSEYLRGMRNCFNYQLTFFLMKLLYYSKLKMSKRCMFSMQMSRVNIHVHAYRQTDKDKKEQI